MNEDTEDEVFVSLLHGSNQNFVRVNLSKYSYSIIRMGGFEEKTFSIPRSNGEIISVSNHGQVLVFIK